MNKSPFSFQKFVLLALAALAVVAGTAEAQVRVDLLMRRSLYVRYEPVVAIVRITNMSGGELELADADNKRWFSFQIENGSGTPVPPYDSDYRLSPIVIGPGQSIERGVNITPLYPISEYGTYRIRPVVYAKQFKRYFSAPRPLNIDITEGRVLWHQTVGVPEGESGAGETREVTLLSHRLPNTTQLYLRIEDKENGRVYCTHQLGRTVSLSSPQIELSPANTVNVLQNVAPKLYLFTEVGLNGEVLQRKEYQALSEAPTLRRNSSTGELAVSGGAFIDPSAQAQQIQTAQPPSVGARPIAAPPAAGKSD